MAKKKTSRKRRSGLPTNTMEDFRLRGDEPPIRGGMGAGFMRQWFGGKDFLDCLIELIKNSRDWRADLINIITTDHSLLCMFDNGLGMNKKNRNAFASVNCTTACGRDQAGKFCTGTKHILFSFASSVRVVTAPKEESDKVYVFEFTANEYEQLAKTEGELMPAVYEKNDITWPYMKEDSYGARFGTMITYVLDNSRSQRIVRGKRLRRELTSRLPDKLHEKVFVDSATFPKKEEVGIIGEVFKTTYTDDPVLGLVTLELYRPEKRLSHEVLRVTGGEIGEAPFSNLVRVLRDMRTLVTDVYTLREVCGTITAEFFAEFANEDRTTIRAEIVDDPRTIRLLKLLKVFAASVQNKLKIRMRNVDDDENLSEKEDLEAVAEMYNNRYEIRSGRGRNEGGGIGPGNRKPRDRGNQRSPLQLKSKDEVEIGETIDMKLVLRGALKGHYTPSDLKWDFSRALGTVTVGSDGIQLTATQEGQGLIVGDLQGTPFVAKAYYRVVEERKLGLSLSAYAQIERGAELTVRAKNTDKLKGDLEWKFEGDGDFSSDDNHALFKAVVEGSAAIMVIDTGDPSATAESQIHIIKPIDKRRLWWIREVAFTFETIDSDMPEFRKPITMVLGTSDVHRIKANCKAPGWQEAKKKGTLREYLRDAIALEFARFARFELEEINLDDYEGSDLPIFIHNIQSEAYMILEEILAAIKNR